MFVHTSRSSTSGIRGGGAPPLRSGRSLPTCPLRSLGQTDSGRSSLAAETGLHAPQPTFAPMVFVLRRAARSPRELVAEHRQAADGCFLCHLVLDDVPVLGQLAVLEAHDIHYDPVRRPA